MSYYRRRLPHLEAPGTPAFVTWRLRGSLPAGRAFQRETCTTGEAFAALDRALDSARSGALWLQRPEIARLVAGRLHEVAGEGLCHLHAYVVMPNHVHVLWTALLEQSDLIRRVKGSTARQANSLLGRGGEPFWQQEYFDRLVRNALEFERIQSYIERNPVRAGLAARAEEFPWSSAGWRG